MNRIIKQILKRILFFINLYLAYLFQYKLKVKRLFIDDSFLNLTLSIPSSSLNRHTPLHMHSMDISFILNGDWDLELHEIIDTERYKRMADIYKNRENVKNSKTYHDFLNSMEKTPVIRHGIKLDTLEKINSYFETYISLIDSMDSYGFKSAADLSLNESDICVLITREGELVHWMVGHHRVAIAKELNTNIIVKICGIHKKYLLNCWGFISYKKIRSIVENI